MSPEPDAEDLSIKGVGISPDRGLFFVQLVNHRHPPARAGVVALSRVGTNRLRDRVNNGLRVRIVCGFDDGGY